MSLLVDIQKRFKGFTLSAQFRSGGVPLGILGASGSGKSMTLKCIAGLITPDTGYIELNGRTLFDSDKKINIRPQKRNIGYLFQNYALFPHMTVRQNIACALQGNQKSQAAAIDALIDKFKLSGLGGRYPGQLSGGQQQRVALARILAYEPEVLLLDEPFSALDGHLKEMLQVDMLDLLQEYHKDVIMVTHDRDEAYKLCEELLILDNGHTVETGNTHTLFAHPCHLLTAKLTGCKNFSAARRSGAAQVEALDWGCTFSVDRPVPDNLTHIGVRAHHFYPAEKAADNSMPVCICELVEGPFEWDILFGIAQPDKQSQKIWWKHAKGENVPKEPKFLCAAPKDILLLTDVDTGRTIKKAGR